MMANYMDLSAFKQIYVVDLCSALCKQVRGNRRRRAWPLPSPDGGTRQDPGLNDSPGFRPMPAPCATAPRLTAGAAKGPAKGLEQRDDRGGRCLHLCSSGADGHPDHLFLLPVQ